MNGKVLKTHWHTQNAWAICDQSVTLGTFVPTLTLGSRLRQGLVKVQAKCEA
jgi:hypothetical protein